MPQFNYYCQRCGETQTKLYKSAYDRPGAIPCGCGGKAHYQMAAPNIKMQESATGRDPMQSKFDRMDSNNEDESGEDRAMEKGIPNIDSKDLYDD